MHARTSFYAWCKLKDVLNEWVVCGGMWISLMNLHHCSTMYLGLFAIHFIHLYPCDHSYCKQTFCYYSRNLIPFIIIYFLLWEKLTCFLKLFRLFTLSSHFIFLTGDYSQFAMSVGVQTIQSRFSGILIYLLSFIMMLTVAVACFHWDEIYWNLKRTYWYEEIAF